jgi:hypothetical protein
MFLSLWDAYICHIGIICGDTFWDLLVQFPVWWRVALWFATDFDRPPQPCKKNKQLVGGADYAHSDS